MKTSLVLLVIAAAALGERVSYEGYKVFRIVPNDTLTLSVLSNLEKLDLGYSFWTDAAAVGKPVDIMVPPHRIFDFKDLLEIQKMDYELFIDNVQTRIEAEKIETRFGEEKMGWDNYHTLDVIYAWLEDLEKQFPGVVTLVKGGSSYENRHILGVHVSFNKQNENRSVFLEAGIHAREWISTSTVTFILNELLTSTDPEVKKLANSYDWYIFPNMNPDGYVYTHEKNRLWRKTRAPYGICFGTDPNRNWAYRWMTGGASNLPCSETYAGPKAFSDIETKSMSEYINSISSKLIGYIAHHAYSQFLVLPYGHTNQHLDNYEELYEVGVEAMKSLSTRYGTKFDVGNIVELLYVATGSSMDWVKGTHKTRITYTYELRDTGRYGFLLPPDQIVPSGLETLDALVTIMTEFEKRN